MKKVAFIFPGQGSQSVGMGKDVYDKYEKIKVLFDSADKELGIELSRMCFEGPEEELKKTYNTQPALLATSVALYEAFKEQLPKPDFVAGHSLGEYSALVASGVIGFNEAVKLVQTRGKLMEEAVPEGRGAMAAILGGNREMVERKCLEDGVEVANFNCPGQIVISGIAESIEKASERIKEAGAKKCIPLSVSGPFHSVWMKPASNGLLPYLNETEMHDASIPVIANVDAKVTEKASEIKEKLHQQIVSSVLWEDSIRNMINQGVDTFIEIGPGKVLTGLIKKIDKEVEFYNIFDIESAEKVIAELSEKTSE